MEIQFWEFVSNVCLTLRCHVIIFTSGHVLLISSGHEWVELWRYPKKFFEIKTFRVDIFSRIGKIKIFHVAKK